MDGTRLPNASMVAADLDHLRKDPQIGRARWMEVPDHVAYACDPPVPSKRVVKYGFGAEYTAERGFTPLVGLRVPARSDEESDFNFQLGAGEASVSGEADYHFPIHLAGTERWWESVEGLIRGETIEIEDARYGNTLRDGVETSIQDVAVGAIVRFDSFSHADRYESSQPGYEGARSRWTGSLEAGFRFRDTGLDGDAAALTGLNEGVRSGLYFDGRVLFGDYLDLYAGGAGSASWWMNGRLAMDTSFEGLGGEADYMRVLAQLEGRRNWKASAKLAGQASLGVSGGWASGGTPTFDYFGAGEEAGFRGLRETEFIGRSFAGLHAGVGVDVGPLLGGIGLGSLRDSGMIFLFGPFADAGLLFDRVENGVSRSCARAIQSFGVQLEILQTTAAIAPLSVSVGYGWSPQAELDESGSFFSRMSVNF
jgi:hypothetical protein